MSIPPQIPLRPVTLEEQAALEQIARATSERVDRVQRSTALLAVAAGQSFAEAARGAGYRTGWAVAKLVRRFTVRGLAGLAIAPGRGRKVT